MKIQVNGENREIAQDSILISDLLKFCEVEMPEMVSVQVNREFVNKQDYNSKKVTHGDEVDFLYFMGGGRK